MKKAAKIIGIILAVLVAIPLVLLLIVSIESQLDSFKVLRRELLKFKRERRKNK